MQNQANQINPQQGLNIGVRKSKLSEIKLAEFDEKYTKWIVLKNHL